MAKQERYPLSYLRQFPTLVAIFVLTCLSAITSPGQTAVQEFRDLLRDQAAFTADDFSAIDRGEIVVKLLPVKDEREVAVCGLVRTQAPVGASLMAFRNSMTQQNQKTILGAGKFSSPPSLEDLQALTLEGRDIEDLKRCVVGDCKLKMSAAMIERFRHEVDWRAPDFRLKATRLFRQILVDYVSDYLARGDLALIEYDDGAQGVRLDEEHRSLLDASLYINDLAPEFANYLKSFPRPELSEVENAVNWTKISFGLKPVTILTHVATYTRSSHGIPQILVVSKQLYANHYFDSSLALTAVISVPLDGKTSDSYLLYTNRSRADALAGSFSRLKRNLVEGEAVTNLRGLLLQTRLNLETSSMNQPDVPGRSEKAKILEWLFGGTRLFWWLITLTVLAVWFRLRRRKPKQIVRQCREKRLDS